MARMSIATIDKPEFINIVPKNPLISECEIKVLYIGENRNHSYITKEVATEMANSLPGCPIVGYFKDDKQDFADHGDRVIFDDEGMHFQCMTRPYGFVAPNAKVWFQKFEDTDEFGNTVAREYLMTTGFLWTGQYPECEGAATATGKHHSMELDEDTLDGYWSKNQKTGMDFFIINDAIFSKLCILGDDVEPCFEGSAVSAPKVSASFTKVDDTFKKTLFSMMQELKFALEGGQQDMDLTNTNTVLEDNLEQETVMENQISTEQSVENSFAASEEEKKEENEFAEVSPKSEDEEDKEDKLAKADEEDEEEEKPSTDHAKKDDEEEKEEPQESEEEEKEEEDKDKKYALLEADFNELQGKYSSLESQYQELLAFKNQIEDEKKDALINSFYMLSDEDKKEVMENKSQYSVDDIEAKLAVICLRKKVNFNLDDTSENDNTKTDSPVTTFNLDEQVSSVPAMVAALRNTQRSRNI